MLYVFYLHYAKIFRSKSFVSLGIQYPFFEKIKWEKEEDKYIWHNAGSFVIKNKNNCKCNNIK